MNTENCDTFRTGTKKHLRWLWPTTHQTNPEDAEIKTFMESMNTKKTRPIRNREPGKKDVRWLWPMTRQTNSEAAEIKTFMKPMNTEKWRHIQLVQKSHRPTKQFQKIQISKHSRNLWTLKNNDPFRTANRKLFTMAMATDP